MADRERDDPSKLTRVPQNVIQTALRNADALPGLPKSYSFRADLIMQALAEAGFSIKDQRGTREGGPDG